MALVIAVQAGAAEQWVVYEGAEGARKGKHIVLMAGDEEYRSEEGLPMLGKILSQRHGFKCTVLFSQDADGTINPNNQTNVPGMHLVGSADLVICQFRFRELPDADMKHLVDYLQAGKPIIAIRTSTHAFDYRRNKSSPYAKFGHNSSDWPGGFGQQVLGDTWVSHHGGHAKESARGLVDGTQEKHPVLRSVRDVWGRSDVYGIVRLKPADVVLLHGLVLTGMKPDDPPNYNKSIMPLVWVREYKWETGNTTKALTSTIGAAVDLQSEDLRRLFVNACYWLTGLEVPAKAAVDYVGEFKPTFFGFGTFRKGVKVSDHKL
ncbi:MAG: hypothetical protein L0Y58_09175 [Verrucomicrobia subdivision 3 bacterium]|nr:hypothetical protein [Limisphaerales bacterium]